MLSLLLPRVQKHFYILHFYISTEASCQASMMKFFHKNSKMDSIINYFHEKAPSQMSDTVLNMSPIYMVTEGFYLIKNTRQLTLPTSEVASVEPLNFKKKNHVCFTILKFSYFRCFHWILNFQNDCDHQNYKKYKVQSFGGEWASVLRRCY